MNILHVMASVDPRYGGPIEALIQADVVGRQFGHTRTIVSLDVADDPWVKTCSVKTVGTGSRAVRRWTNRVPLLRYGFTPHLMPWLRAHLGRFDRVVVHGLWNYTALAARRILPYQPKPYFVIPHGMLDPWFRHAYPLKNRFKQMAWWMAEGPLLHSAKAVLFTSEGERQAAEGAFRPYRFRQVVIGYGTGDVPAPTDAQRVAFKTSLPALGSRPYILFLGRLHPKKGCDLLLRAYADVLKATAAPDIVLAGPDPVGWQMTLRALASDLGIADRVHWPGMLGGDAKWGALHGCAGFILPSHSENFGVAVAEALACGKPVLLTDKVNIAPDILACAAGVVEADTLSGVRRLLTRFLATDEAARRSLGERARSCFLDKFHIDRVAEKTLAILESAGEGW